MGRMLPIIVIPVTLGPAFVAWAVLTRRLPVGCAAWRWSSPSCSRAACGRSFATKASKESRSHSSNGAGRRRRSSECWNRRERTETAAPTRQGYGGQRRPLRLGRKRVPLPLPGSLSTLRATRRLRHRVARSGQPVSCRVEVSLGDPGPTPAAWPGFRGPEARRRRSRRDHRDRLVQVAAGTGLAPAHRTGLVVVRGPRRSPLHAGAARR